MTGNKKMNEQGLKIAITVFKEASKILDAKMKEGLRTIKIQKAVTELIGKEVQIQDDNHILSISQGIPSIILNAFSIELNLKLLVYQKTGKAKTGHGLHTLFKELDDITKQSVSIDVCTELNIDKAKFEENLIDNGKVFIDWRYFYENQQNANISFLQSFGETIKKLTHF